MPSIPVSTSIVSRAKPIYLAALSAVGIGGPARLLPYSAPQCSAPRKVVLQQRAVGDYIQETVDSGVQAASALWP